MKIDILGVKIDNDTMDEAVAKVMDYLDGNSKHTLYTPNPEFVMTAQDDKDFMRILNKGDLVVPDGIGIVIASRMMKKNIPERVAGYDLIQNIFKELKNTNKTVYFFGAAKGVAAKAAEKMKELHKGLGIVGVHDGYFDEEEEKKIIESINKLRPDLLIVGLGAPKQEKWIRDHIQELDIKVAAALGGSLDGMAGNVKRAPLIFQRLNLEWFYRLIKQPSRAKRMLKLPLFLLKVIMNRKG